MPEPRPFRFGLVMSAPTRARFVEEAKKAEVLGYSVLLNSDHLDGTHVSQFSPMVALAAAAMSTETLRLGTSVINQAFRHPAVFAREAASLDLLSDGRLEIGLGGGSAEVEHRRAGIPWGSGRERVERMWEFFEVVAGLLEPGQFSYQGRYFQIDQMDGEPSPTSKPRPPMMVGGTGPRNLAWATREADIVSTVAGTPEAMDRQVAIIEEASATSCRSPERNAMVMAVAVTDGSPIAALRERPDYEKARMLISRQQGSDASDEDFLGSPLVLAGSSSAVAEELIGRRERWGISYYAVHSQEMDEFAPVIEELAGK